MDPTVSSGCQLALTSVSQNGPQSHCSCLMWGTLHPSCVRFTHQMPPSSSALSQRSPRKHAPQTPACNPCNPCIPRVTREAGYALLFITSCLGSFHLIQEKDFLQIPPAGCASGSTSHPPRAGREVGCVPHGGAGPQWEGDVNGYFPRVWAEQ